MKVSRTHAVAALFLLAAATPAQAFEFYADEFRGVLNGSPVFLDTFDGSTAPPAAPKFLTNVALTPSYNLTGNFAAPGTGKLPFTTAQTVVSRANPNFLVNKLTLTSSNASGATVNPLQSGSTFEVSAVFDLTMPQKNDEAYCLELGDWQANSKNDPALWAREVIRLCVHKNSDNGSVRVRFNQKDASTGVSTLIDKVAVETGHQQIRFRLARNDAAKNAVTASYAYLDGGVAGKEASLTGSASVFTYKPYTIPALLAFTPVSSADTSGTTNKLTLNAHIEVSSDYQGKTGNIYILVLTPGMGIFVHNGSNWAFWSGGTIPAYASGVALKSQDIPLLKEMDASLFVGTKVYVGYGLSDSDMLDNGLYNLVNTIQ